MTPYHAEPGIAIYHERCEDVMAAMHDDSVDIVVTSPPYNMGLVPGGNGRGMYRPGSGVKGGRFRDGYDSAGGGYGDAMNQHDYDTWQRRCVAEMYRVARLAVFYNHRPRVEHGKLRTPLGLDFGDVPLRQIITWDRGTGIDVTRRAFCTVGEWVLLFAKSAFEMTHAASGYGDVWRLGMAHGVDHPAPFPVALPARCIEVTGASSVLDPFMGSGTTLRAAKDAGIHAIGVDLSARYCNVAVDRLRQGSLFEAGQS